MIFCRTDRPLLGLDLATVRPDNDLRVVVSGHLNCLEWVDPQVDSGHLAEATDQRNYRKQGGRLVQDLQDITLDIDHLEHDLPAIDRLDIAHLVTDHPVIDLLVLGTCHTMAAGIGDVIHTTIGVGTTTETTGGPGPRPVLLQVG
jgi:hypothetical protein